MRRNAAAAQPDIAPQRETQRRELTEMRGTFDRRALETQLLCNSAIVYGSVAIVILLRQHLLRRAQRAGQYPVLFVDRCFKGRHS